MKRILPFLMVFMLIAAGCAEDEKPAAVTPEEFYSKMCGKLLSGSMTSYEMYDAYLASVSKALVGIEEYEKNVALWREDSEAAGICYTGVSDVKSTALDGDIFEITASLNYTEDGGEKSRQVKEYLTAEDGKLKYLYRGFIGKKTFTMSEDASHQPLHMTAADVYFTPERTLIEFTMKNDSSSVYSFGNGAEGSKIRLETGDGEVKSKLENPVRVKSGSETKLDVWFPTNSRTFKTITVCGIYSVDYMGNIIDNGGFDYPIMFQYIKADSSGSNKENGAE